MTTQAAPLFANNWNVYQKIIFMNYMLHLEIGVNTEEAIKKISQKTALEVLDLGCGDAHQIAKVLQQFSIASYTGFDLSAPALKIAAENLTSLNARIELKQGPMEELISTESQIFDIIYSSFAMHHLDDFGKQVLFEKCFSALKPGGILIYIDVTRKTKQSRADYIDRYVDHMKEHWNVLSAEEIGLIVEHINSCDFPADRNDLFHWVHKLGFTVSAQFEGDGKHGMFVFKKSES